LYVLLNKKEREKKNEIKKNCIQACWFFFHQNDRFAVTSLCLFSPFRQREKSRMAKNDVNTVAAQGFQQAATLYEQARPSYPSEAIDWIKSLCDKPDIIIDMGAGTGKLTRLLGTMGARELVAIEPVSAMRENLKKIPIITKIIDGTAENIPFEDHTVDMIICGQSFHWFANHRALAEFNRVLKSNGLLVLLWNIQDNTGEKWADTMSKYIDSFKPDEAVRYKSTEWKEAFDDQNLFSTVQFKQFSHQERITRDLAMKRVLSISFIAALPSEQQTKLVQELEKMLDNVDEVRGQQEFDIKHFTDVYWCSPLKSSS
jgi:ubiquinone/menaquinone biosynthesis C-methylase UbiE